MADHKNSKRGHVDSFIVRSLLWVDDRSKVDKFFWGIVVVGVLLTLLDLFYKKKTYFSTEAFFGFYSFYGFIMCAALVVAARALRVVLMRSEDYYAPTDVESEDHPEFDLNRKEADV